MSCFYTELCTFFKKKQEMNTFVLSPFKIVKKQKNCTGLERVKRILLALNSNQTLTRVQPTLSLHIKTKKKLTYGLKW